MKLIVDIPDAVYKNVQDGLYCGTLYNELRNGIPHQKMGCEGCIHEKTGDNSTYPCSHCCRCYTDKYKRKSEE